MPKQTYHLTITDAQGVELVNADVSPTRGKALFNAYKQLGKCLTDWGMDELGESLAWVSMELQEVSA